MPKRPDLMGLSDIARLAGVQRSAVANWRDRHDSFPKPVPVAGAGPVFERDAVLAWLEANRPTNLRLEQWLWDAACQVRGHHGVEGLKV